MKHKKWSIRLHISLLFMRKYKKVCITNVIVNNTNINVRIEHGGQKRNSHNASKRTLDIEVRMSVVFGKLFVRKAVWKEMWGKMFLVWDFYILRWDFYIRWMDRNLMVKNRNWKRSVPYINLLKSLSKWSTYKRDFT